MKRRRESLSMGRFKKIVDEYVEMGGTELSFCTTIGDPLLDKQLLERARYVRNYSQIETLGFVTTLQWLHLHNIHEFMKSGFTWLGISIVLSGREKYREFFGVDMYEYVIDNLKRLIDENDSNGKRMFIGIDIKPTNETINEIIGHKDFKTISMLLKRDISLQVKHRTLFVDDWIGAVKLPHYLKKRNLYPRMYRPCCLLYHTLAIFSNGNIGVCGCRDYEANSQLILGNIESDFLREIWNGERIKRLRSQWREKNIVPEICKKCTHYVY